MSLERSAREIAALWDRADAANAAHDHDAMLTAYRELLDHPCAHHAVDTAEVLDEVHRTLRVLGRFDEAIEAKRHAIAAGYRSSPDPEADIAECLVEAGRLDQAAALYAELRERDPDDVWLYNSAGLTYPGVDDGEALRWLVEGIEVAITTGDPDQVIGQLMDLAGRQWDRLGETPDDELLARADEFRQSWTRPPPRNRWKGAVTPDQKPERCTHCGFDPDRPPTTPRRQNLRPNDVVTSLAWFPSDQWPEAVRRWPQLLDDRPEDHREYTEWLEARLKWMSKHLPGQRLSVAPLDVAELDRHAGDEAGEGAGRSSLAAEMARTRRTLPWPPGRNHPCWCGSGHKYKRCCGPVSPAEDTPASE